LLSAPILLYRPLFNRGVLSFENAGPIEFDVGIVLLDEPDGSLVERRASDPDAGRGSEPVQDPGAGFASTAAASRVYDERVFVPALVAGKPQVRQDYFLF
jgi:hypothetical protein